MDPHWTSGNRVTLLENGEAYFPALLDAIGRARREIVLETFIFFEDKVGQALRDALVDAGRRGVAIDVLVDGYGSDELTPAFLAPMTAAGIRIRAFDPRARVFGMRLNVLRRMHRKLVVIDGELAFAGGINISADHLADFGPRAKQDYAVALTGPIVDVIHRFVRVASRNGDARGADPGRPASASRRFERPLSGRERPAAAPAATPQPWKALTGDEPPPALETHTVDALFVTRDNRRHRDDIEWHYRLAIRQARKRVLIANAYFFPGYRLLRELRNAARRGVQVDLILQGEPDMPFARNAATMLYGHLQRAGVRIHEYCRRPLHGKVAVVDDAWATAGSSNLDPLSLSLNLEANVVLHGRGFACHLRDRLEQLIEHECRLVPEEPRAMHRRPWPLVRGLVLFHVLRHFPSWAGMLPEHRPKLIQRQGEAELTPDGADLGPDDREPTTATEPTTRPGRAARLRRALGLAYTVLALAVAGWLATRANWADAGRALADLPLRTLALAAGLAAASHLVYACYDLVARHETGHRLSTATVLRICFVSYAFNLNMGSLFGGIASRYALYGREGLAPATVTRIVALSLLTNWSGYLLLAGLVVTVHPQPIATVSHLSAPTLRLAGFLMLGGVAAWLALCAFSIRRTWSIRGHEVRLPSPGIAAAQLLLSTTNWLLMGVLVWMLLGQRIDFFTTQATLLAAAVAGVITHVPAGLGVLEGVFVTALAGRAGEGTLLAALLTYRVLYYLIPLVAATALLLTTRRRPDQSATKSAIARPRAGSATALM